MSSIVLTDEQIAQALNLAGVTDYADVPLSYDLEIARAIEQAVLQSYDSQLLRLLVDIRFAAGDDGKRMQDELVEHIAGLRKDAERYRWLKDRYKDGPGMFDNDAIDAAMEKQK